MMAQVATADSKNFTRARTGYLPTLDGWRAIAILLVLLDHAGMYYFSDQGPHPSARLEAYSARGAFGVDIFFAISGFLICTLLLREQQKRDSINLRSFYIRRVFRILPPYLLYLAVLAVLAAIGCIVVLPREWIACLLFFRNYLPFLHQSRDIGWYTGHFWSLAVEEHFYLLWPTMLLLLKRRRAAIAAIGLIIAITIWRTADLYHAFVPTRLIEIYDHRTDYRLDSLLWGCLLAIVFAAESGRQWLAKLINPAVWLLCAAALLVLTADFFTRSNLRIAVASTLRPPLFAAVVVATVANPQWFVGKMLEDARLRWIGRISYSLYIWQQLFLVVQLVPRPLPFGRWQEVPLAFVGIFGCALISYYLIEQPAVRLGHRLAQGLPSTISSNPPSLAPVAAG